MKLLLEYLPIAIFFIVFKWAEQTKELLKPLFSPEQFEYIANMEALVLATAVLIPATLLQILVAKLVWKKVEKMHIITLVIVLVLGGLTVLLQDKNFIFWKPTVIKWLFALAFVLSPIFTNKHLLEHMMDSANIKLPDHVWKNLTNAWVAFFFLSGVANLYVAYYFSEDFWVDFKLFGMLGITIVFVIAQGIYMAKFIPKDELVKTDKEDSK